ncbi:MAG: hypothetical protein WCO69_00045 [Candidatus Omnitrophota bacterium]
MLKKAKAQSLAEYMVLLTIIAVVASTMTPMFRRGLQSLIKAGADQIGEQKQSEQNTEQGYTESQNSSTQQSGQDITHDYFGAKDTQTYRETLTTSNSYTNMGFTKGD